MNDVRVVRKRALGFGISLAFVGFLLFCSAYISEEEVTSGLETVSECFDRWNITGFFYQSDNLVLAVPTDPVEPYPFGGYNVSIVDPNGNKTVFLFEFQYGPKCNITVLENEGGLEVEEGVRVLGGITNYSGNYTAFVDELARAWYKGPPRFLTLYNEIEDKQVKYPYGSFLPAGLIVLFIGLGLSLWAVMSKKTSVRRRAKK